MDEETRSDSHQDNEDRPKTTFLSALFGLDPHPRRDDENDELLPDPIAEQPEQHALAHQFESLPHHPAHLLDRFLYLPPFAGLVDLTRTLLHRRRNPFYHALLRRFWGRRSWLILTGWVVAIGIAVIPLTYLEMKVVNGPLASVTKFRFALFLFPDFTCTPVFYLALLFGVRIVHLLRDPASQSEVGILPNAQVSMLRAISVQLVATAVLLTLFGLLTRPIFLLFSPALRAANLPPGTPPVQWIISLFGLPKSVSFVPGWLLAWGNLFCVRLLILGIVVLAFARGRTVPQAIGLAVVAEYVLSVYTDTISWVGIALHRWLAQLAPTHPFPWPLMDLFFIPVHLLIIGAIWHWIHRRVAQVEM